ncbi:YolD-like family protein [Oceanobacillus sp. CFH 90083]|uniref:YolD-like family protein n=1 Tax=Oceanobacillus sp. CFH 90083 TaxID=2592336 RepID=UPI00128C5F56|nr:YolD-like family protein [Oceanobacillus sp. CFH 90083]
MTNDRGSKKWTAMMLPEHVALLKEVKKEYYHEAKPILDEQQLEEIHLKLMLAQKDSLPVQVKYFTDGKSVHIKGYIHAINYISKYIIINEVRLESSEIIDVEIG